MKKGSIKQGEDVDILGYFSAPLRTKVVSMDTFGKTMSQAEAGDSVMMFFRGTNPQNLYRGQMVSATNTLKLFTTFDGSMTMLRPEEGGRDRSFNQRFKAQVRGLHS